MGKTAEILEVEPKNNRAFLNRPGMRERMFGVKDPRFLNGHNYLAGFDRTVGWTGAIVRLFTVDATNGFLKEKRHAPRLKHMVITLGLDDSVAAFYVRDGQVINPDFLEHRAIETVGENLRAVVYGSIYPRQKRWERALHKVTIHRAQKLSSQKQLEPVNPQELVDFTLAQRLLNRLSAERLEIAMTESIRKEE